MPNGGSHRERDPYSQRPEDDNWVLVWMNQYWFHTDYESIRFNLDDKISYKGGDFHGLVEFVDSQYYGYEYMLLTFTRHYDCPQVTMKFGKVVGTDNWLHVDRRDWNNNCMLMPAEFQGIDSAGGGLPEMHPSHYGMSYRECLAPSV